MASMRGAAETSYKAKIDRMLSDPGTKIRTAKTGDKATGHAYAQPDGSMGEAQGGYADDYETEAENERMVAEKRGKPRLDRVGYKKGGRVKGTTNVNVIIAPQGGAPAGGPPPMPPPGAMPPPPPGMGAGPGGPPMPPPGPMPRKNGGRVAYASGGKVPMDGGAGGGKGRLEKIKEYGSRAKPGGKAGTM